MVDVIKGRCIANDVGVCVPKCWYALQWCVCVGAPGGASSGSRRMEDQVWQTTLHFATLPGSHAFGKLLHHIMFLYIAAQKYAI